MSIKISDLINTKVSEAQFTEKDFYSVHFEDDYSNDVEDDETAQTFNRVYRELNDLVVSKSALAEKYIEAAGADEKMHVHAQYLAADTGLKIKVAEYLIANTALRQMLIGYRARVREQLKEYSWPHKINIS